MTLPITKSLEDSPTRLYTIYQGTGILIVALLTYNIVLRPSPFSLAGMIDKLGRDLQIHEKFGRKWIRMGDEEKGAIVIRTLYLMKESSENQVPPTVINQEVATATVTMTTTSTTDTTLMPSQREVSEVGRVYHHGYKTVQLEAMNGIDETDSTRKVESSM